MVNLRKYGVFKCVSILVATLLIVFTTTSFVFAYTSTFVLPASITQTFDYCFYLQHNGNTLFSTNPNESVENDLIDVQSIATDAIIVKSEYQNFIKNSESKIIFTISNSSTASKFYSLQLDSVNVYGVEVSSANFGNNVAVESTGTTLSVGLSSTYFQIDAEDVVAFTIKFVNKYVPDGYSQLEYIESNGTQYIQTSLTPNSNHKWVFVFENTVTNQSGANYMGSFSSSRVSIVSYGASNTIGQITTGLSSPSGMSIPIDLNKHTIILSLKDKYFQYDSDQYSLSGTYSATDLPNIKIFTDGNGVNSKIKLYSAQIFENDVLVGNYIPCKNSENTFGVYDTVTKTFLTNAGSGTFTGA